MDMDTVTSIAENNPLATAVIGLGLVWAVGNYLRASAVGVKVGGVAVSHDGAMRAARERQQAALAARSAEAQPASTPNKPAPAPQKPASQPGGAEMPARMRAAMERQQREEAAAKRGATSTNPASAAPEAPPAATSCTKKKETTAEKLARIQKGKGPSDHNPLENRSTNSSAGSTFNRKKGGG